MLAFSLWYKIFFLVFLKAKCDGNKSSLTWKLFELFSIHDSFAMLTGVGSASAIPAAGLR